MELLITNMDDFLTIADANKCCELYNIKTQHVNVIVIIVVD